MNNPEEILRDAMNMANDLSGKMDKLMRLTTESLRQLPETEQKKAEFIMRDIEKVKKAVKKGDLESLNELTKRYASNDN